MCFLFECLQCLQMRKMPNKDGKKEKKEKPKAATSTVIPGTRAPPARSVPKQKMSQGRRM